jgi:magnesium transporter
MVFTVYRGGVETAVEASELATLPASGGTVWIDVVGPSPEEREELARSLDVLRALDLDLLRRRGRPPRTKVLPDSAFVRCYAIIFNGDLESQEIHAVAAATSLITLRYGTPFDLTPVADRWRRVSEPAGTDGGSLLAMVLDEIVDSYFDTVDAFEEAADALEERVFTPGEPPNEREAGRLNEILQRDVHHLRGELTKFRREILPYGEIRGLAQRAPSFVPAEAVAEFRDLGDAVLRVVELIDNARDQLTSTFEAVLAQVSNQLNITMKKLSAWAAILLVPTLIAGIYGMNFDQMPELRWRLGYPGALLSMGAAAGILYVVFKRRNWL